MDEHFINIQLSGCVLRDQSIAWIDSHMDNWRQKLAQWFYIIGLPRIVFSSQEIVTFGPKVWFFVIKKTLLGVKQPS